MNGVIVPLLYMYLPVILIGSLVLSTLFEILTWAVVLRARLGFSDFLAISGWMTLVQVVSTPLSFGISLLLYATSIGLFAPSPALLALLLQAPTPVANPIGSIVGFLLAPILLEYWLWSDARRWVVNGSDKLSVQRALTLSKTMLAGGVVAANLTSFSVGFLLTVFADGFYWVVTVFAFYCALILLFMGVNFLNKYYAATPVAEPTRSYSTSEPSWRRMHSSRVVRTAIQARRKGNVSLLALVVILVFLATVTVPILFDSPFVGRNPTYVNLSEAQGILAEDGTLHVAWFRRTIGFSETNVLLYRRFGGGQWLDTEVVANDDYVQAWSGHPSLACNGSSQLAAGWIAADSVYWNRTRACYRLFDGTAWQSIQMLPELRCRYMDLAYDAEGRLHFLWASIKTNASTTTWELFHWESNSSSPPTLLASLDQDHYDIGGCRLLHDGQSQLYAVWTQLQLDESRSEAICTLTFANGSWLGLNSVVNGSSYLHSWDAVTGANGTIHIAWSMYDGYYETTVYHVSGTNATWNEPFLLGRGMFSQVRIAAEEGGTVLVAWSSDMANSWSYRELVDHEWQALAVLALPPSYPYEPLELLLRSSSECYAIRREAIRMVEQLVFYALHHDGILTIYPIDPADSRVLLWLQVTTSYQGLSLLIGVMLLTPISVHLLRRCLGNMLARPNRLEGA